MAEMTFDEAVEWLSHKTEQEVAVEIGTSDPTVAIDAMTIPLVMWVKLGSVEPASETDKDRLMILIRLPNMKRSRFYLDPASVTKVEGGAGSFGCGSTKLSMWASPASHSLARANLTRKKCSRNLHSQLPERGATRSEGLSKL
jgi:hypothetical protein